MNSMSGETQMVVEKIIQYCHPEKIILFGSLARGSENSHSDIDLLIVKKSNKRRPFRVKEIFEAVRDIDRDYPLDPIVYTPEEIDQRLALGDYFIKEVMEQGKLLYGSK